jgi:pimeloyl-ACP methyl ester carboxylesterase
MYAAMVPRMLGQPDRLDRLRSLDVPTLVVVGDQDRPFLGPSRRLAEAIGGSWLVELPDAGHSPQFEAPDAWWDAVAGFLGEVRAGRAVDGVAG